MAEKDITEKSFMALDDVFADIFNVLVFQGQKVVREEDLTDRVTTSQYKADNGKLHEQERDVFKGWKGHGFSLVLAGIENQAVPDKDMPFRVIGYDGAAYRSQLLKRKKKDSSVEISSSESERVRFPVITIVLYFGKKPWTCPKNLKGCFYPPLPQDNVGRLLDEYIQDYKVHVFDIPRLPKETVQLFQSDFKAVAEYFTNVYTNPKYVPEPYVIRHVDEFLKLMKVLTGDCRYEEMVFDEEEKKEGIDVCRVLDYREARGMEKMTELIKILAEEERLEEIKLVTKDEKVRKEYMVRYGIA